MNVDYQTFLAAKKPRAVPVGIEAPSLNAKLFDFQAACVDFALRQGRCGLYLDTGLGKTFCQLEWADKAMRASNGWALILTPLAVARQMEREAQARGYDARVIRDQSEARAGINICNYDRMDRIEPDKFGVVSLDEASILKNFSGKTTRALIEIFRDHRFKMAATATPAPNDHMELGQQSEFLSAMNGSEMLSRFFINDASTASQTWRLKKHAETDFWEWMASWSRMAQSPEDLGYDGTRFILPKLDVIRHRAIGSTIRNDTDDLFGRGISATNMFDIKRQTLDARVRLASQLVMDDLCAASGSLSHANKKTPATSSGASATRKITDSERAATPSQKPPERKNRPSIERLGCSAPTGSTDTTAEHFSASKTGLAPYAGPEKPAGSGTSTLTTATKRDWSEGSCASIAISDSLISETSPIICETLPTILSDRQHKKWVLWCDTNDEQDALEAILGPLAVSIRGSMSPEEKEELHDAWLYGDAPCIITKPSIFGQGVNWQLCHSVIFVGRNFSYEAWYQAVRRCWRFGQTNTVTVHIIVAEGEDQIGRVIDRKADEHASMKRAMAAAMKRATTQKTRRLVDYDPRHQGRTPTWLRSAA